MKRILNAALLIMIAATTITAQKEGNVTIQSNEPIKVWITNASTTAGWILNLKGETPFKTELPPGNYTLALQFPDGTSQSRTLTVKKNCTTRLDVHYKPPTCPTCAPAVTPTPTIAPTPEPKPEPETKPEPKPTLFDKCCGCKRDDLKARLDLFAIQLHSNPSARGRIVAGTDKSGRPNPDAPKALVYLITQRRVDASRLELVAEDTTCVELWIVP